MAANKKSVSTAVVRTWGRANLDLVPAEGHKCLTKTARGLLHPTVITAFHKANKGKVYASKVAESPTVTFKAVVLDSIGRKVTREVTMTTAEARTLLGQDTSRRGRLSLTTLGEAYSAHFASDVADTFTTAA